MGKLALFSVFAALVMGSLFFRQSARSHQASVETQSAYQEEVLATEIAQSAMNMAMTKVNLAGMNYDNAVISLNGALESGEPNPTGKTTGTLYGGNYEVTARMIDGQTFMVKATSTFGDKTAEFKRYHRIPMFRVNNWSTLSFELLPGGWSIHCHSLYIQRSIPVSNVALDGAGNLIASDPKNTNMPKYGQVSQDGRWFIGEPEMILPTDKHFNNPPATYTLANMVLPPNSQINFIMGVETTRCSSYQGVHISRFNASRYGKGVNYALDANPADPSNLQEGLLSTIEQHPTEVNTWRLSMEDQIHRYNMPHEMIADIKANGYPATHPNGTWDAVNKTYGGTGWNGTRDAYGYREHSNSGDYADFFDFMVEIKWIPCSGTC